MAKRCDIQYPLLQPLEEAWRLRSEAIKKYKEAKPFAKELRRAFLTEKIKEYEDLDETKKAKIVTSISKKEEIQEDHKDIKLATKPFSSQINHITIQDPTTTTGF